MKTIHMIYFITTTLVLGACGDSNSDQEQMLQNSWNLTQVNGEGTIVTGGDSQPFSLTSGEVSYVLTFEESAYILAGSYDLTTETNINGIKEFETLTYSGSSGQGSYTLMDDIITSTGPLLGVQVAQVNLGADVGEQSATITMLNEDQLTLSTTISKSKTTDSVLITVNTDLRMVFIKR